jgi:thiol:disulfide interchange protein
MNYISKIKLLLIMLLLAITQVNVAQILKPVKVTTSVKALANNEFLLQINLAIDDKFHVYSQHITNDGPVPSSAKFKPSAAYKIIGAVTEKGKMIQEYDKNFEMQLKYYEHAVTFEQKIQLTEATAKIACEFEYMTCNDHECLPPELKKLVFDVKATNAAQLKKNEVEIREQPITEPSVNVQTSSVSKDCCCAGCTKNEIKKTPKLRKGNPQSFEVTDQPSASDPWWKILLNGVFAGLIALLMPCVFPMIPLTVSFFTKRSTSKKKGLMNALIYGISIILLFVILGFLVGNKLNAWSSSALFNLIFFVVFILFAISFLGAFEITIPNSIINKTDRASEKGGLIGIFFMAFTMVLVSFSCTGPFITWAINVKSESMFAAALAMFGFGFTFALPFMFFAFFPGWLQSLPKSGSWLNTIKVSFGFIELAAAFKFLSNVDQAYHWNVITRELFLVIWIIVFGLLGFYLLGKLKFNHDDDLPHNDYGKPYLTVTRFLLATLTLCFTLYLVPGLWGAPLKWISGFPPPVFYNEGTWTNKYNSVEEDAPEHTQKGPHGINVFHNYDEALSYSKEIKKPLFVDFTGWSCVNCRKMEESVWSNPEVLKLLKEEFVVVSLYVDDRAPLEKEKQLADYEGEIMTTQGDYNTNMQIIKYKKNAQPYYVLLNGKEILLNNPSPANFDVNQYLKFLQIGIDNYTTE